MARERANAGETAQKGAAFNFLRAASCHEGAHISGRERCEISERWLAAEMLRQKGEELGQVTLIGFYSMGRGAAFFRQMLKPALRFAREAGANTLVGGLRRTVYLGESAQHEIALDGCDAVVRVAELNPKRVHAAGERVTLEIDADDVVPLAG